MSGFLDFLRMVMGWWSSSSAAVGDPTRIITFNGQLSGAIEFSGSVSEEIVFSGQLSDAIEFRGSM